MHRPVLGRAAACLRLAIGALALAAAGAHAQDLEPRSYVNTPVGMNFLIGGYAYIDGQLEFDPAVPIADGNYYSNTFVAAYAHSFGILGNSAKFDVIVPYSSFTGSALVNGQNKTRAMSGLNDPRFRVSVNFYGAPALTVQEHANYKQDLLIGASVQVTAPWGDYDDTKLVNLGNNRWSFKPELGISKAWDQWVVEFAPGVTFYTENNDFFNGGTLKQDPLYSVQTHVVYNFKSGIWLAADGTYYSGGRTTINGVRNQNLQSNTRGGLTLALPVNRNNSIKLAVSGGTSSRTGTQFNAVGIAWQYRWGGGY